MSVVVSLAARKGSRQPDVARRRLPDGRSAQIVILPCIRREALRDDMRAGRSGPCEREGERCA
ncbi:hypothetical protein [Antarcticirhabdus aurantiaca]|uniref:Uncharacterized protein n=1 Tax=Antarcticirhabdus aurantiaca TaxID=2606717 RepID=A0ACD4NIX6_9HYPH|nr:hypothetical protein [Antarcticirhabdus aurantiaca]WAJ26719.1 hypothetical protein OXU80_17855 [Jeongeuplla avenae]